MDYSVKRQDSEPIPRIPITRHVEFDQLLEPKLPDHVTI